MQYSGGVYKIADWSHITNAHTVPGTITLFQSKKKIRLVAHHQCPYRTRYYYYCYCCEYYYHY